MLFLKLPLLIFSSNTIELRYSGLNYDAYMVVAYLPQCTILCEALLYRMVLDITYLRYNILNFTDL